MSETKNDQATGGHAPEVEHPAEDHELRTTLAWLRAEGPKLGLAIAVAIAIAVGIGWMRHQRNRATEDAALQLEQARSAEEFESIAEAFPKTASGALALLGAAAEHFHAGHFAEAAEAYDRFLERHAGHAMVSAARLNRVACDEAREQWAEARAGYEAVLQSDPPSHVLAQAVLGLGRTLEASDRFAEARALYEDHLVRLAASEWSAWIEEALQGVNRRLRAADGMDG